MKLDPLHPAASVIDRVRSEGIVVHRLLAFTRRSTVVMIGDEHDPEVLKLFFGSDHVLDALPQERRSSAYGFYWYASKTVEERSYERDAVLIEIAVTTAMTGIAGWPILLGTGVLDDIRYIRLRWIRGSTFQFPSRATIDEILASISILAGVADALVGLHRAGYIHRDIYHENILVNGTVATLIDLGNAKQIGKVLGPVGKNPEPHWPPEYLTGFASAETAADIYSFGVLLHRTITGDIPRPWSASLLAEASDTQMAELALSCIERRPEVRPTAEDVAAGLRAWLAINGG